MKALVRYGGEANALRIQDMPEPQPTSGQVLLRVIGCGICGTDTLHRREPLSWWRHPYIVGHEFTGTIAALGPDVTGFTVGERVASEPFGKWCGHCEMCRTGRVNNCREHSDVGFGLNGAFAEFIAMPARGLHRLPDSVDAAQAAILEPLAAAYNALFAESRTRPADFVVVLGCGPVGLLCAIQAQIAGAEVLITGAAGDEYRLQQARAIGIPHVIRADQQDVVALVGKMTAPNGPDLIVDAVGSAVTFDQALEMAGPGGQITKIGWFHGQQPKNMDRVVGKNLRIHGVYGQTWDAWEKCIRLMAQGKIPLDKLVNNQLPLAQWERGFDQMEARQAVKVVLEPNGGE